MKAQPVSCAVTGIRARAVPRPAEMPTGPTFIRSGTGKTISIICGTLHWLEDFRQRAKDADANTSAGGFPVPGRETTIARGDAGMCAYPCYMPSSTPHHMQKPASTTTIQIGCVSTEPR
jgi:hypothetical protein